MPCSYFAKEAEWKLPLTPKPRTVILPVHLLHKPVPRGDEGLVLAPCSCPGLRDGLLVEPPGCFPGHPTAKQDEICALQFFLKNEVPFIDTAYHVPSVLKWSPFETCIIF